VQESDNKTWPWHWSCEEERVDTRRSRIYGSKVLEKGFKGLLKSSRGPGLQGYMVLRLWRGCWWWWLYVLITSWCVTDHPKTYWLKSTLICYFLQLCEWTGDLLSHLVSAETPPFISIDFCLRHLIPQVFPHGKVRCPDSHIALRLRSKWQFPLGKYLLNFC
jgi:hypothetical protein